MKKILFTIACMLLACLSTQAQDDLQSIVNKESLPIALENDETYPWTVADGVATSMKATDRPTMSASSIKFSYENTSSDLILTFDGRNNGRYYYVVLIYIDGEYIKEATYVDGNRGWYYNCIKLPAGNHLVEIRDSVQAHPSSNSYGQIRNVCFTEANSEYYSSNLLEEGSLPVTFSTDDTFICPVNIDGTICLKHLGLANSSVRLKAKFTIDKPSLFTWTQGSDNNSASHQLICYIDEGFYDYTAQSEYTWSVCLPPGEHIVEWVDTLGNTTADIYGYVKDIMLTDEFDGKVEVNLTSEGTLGAKVLDPQNPGGFVNHVHDVKYLKVNGVMGAKDWAELKTMTNIRGVDLSGVTSATDVPDNQFYKTTNFNSILLPPNTTSIGENAFRGTKLLSIEIPSSVVKIGRLAFESSLLSKISFANESRLNYIGDAAFQLSKSLMSIELPNSLKTLALNSGGNAHTFSECVRLKSIKFSDSLTVIPTYTCDGCSSLKKVLLPSKLQRINLCAFRRCAIDSLIIPESVTYIEYNSYSNSPFYLIGNLKYVELPPLVSNYGYLANSCPSIEKIVCKTATPPTITNDPFEGLNKQNVTLYVPSFALTDYKVDNYWSQFGTILPMERDMDYWRLAGNLNLYEGKRMKGKPDLDLYYDGKLCVSGNDPMPTRNLNFFVNESNPGVLLNDCGQFTADSITTRFSINANTWYFITPMHDVRLSDVRHSDAEASYVFRYYNAAYRAENGATKNAASWQDVTEGVLHAGQGYIYQSNRAGELIMPAAKETQANIFNMAEVTTVLATNEAENAVNANWNYVGNPFPCYYDIRYMDFTAPITIRNGSNYNAYSITDDDFVLRPMQPFFVQKPNDVDQIVFRHEGRQTSSTVSRTSAPALTTAEKARFVFNVEISDGEQKDHTRVVFNNAAKMDYELERDASKFMSEDIRMPQIYSLDTQGNRLAINERPEQDGMVSLGVHIGSYGTYTISATRADASVLLYDSLADVTVDLASESYTFSSSAADYQNRFYLNASGATGIKSHTTDLPQGEGADSYYNLAGQKVTKEFNGIVIRNGRKYLVPGLRAKD